MSSNDGFVRTHRGLPPVLEEARRSIKAIAEGYGLDFFETVFLMCSFEEINMLASYGGFPTRYPHWRFGMEYLEMSKGYEWGLQKIYEMVINTDPSYAYLLDNNTMVDQKLVMAHVFGHVDFFKNNAWFTPTNRKMLDQMANHATRIRRYIDRYGHGEVETWIDTCLSIDNLIDPHSMHIKRSRTRTAAEVEAVELEDGVHKLPARKYMDRYINPPEFLAAQRKKREEERKQMRRFPEEPQRDLMLFFMRHASLPTWKQDILQIIRDEAYYFAPQAQTKVMNEGWACLVGSTVVITERGLEDMRSLVGRQGGIVWDGEEAQRVVDRNIIRDHETVKITTRRGIVLEGSNNHRVMLADGETWCRLDELEVGSRLRVSGAEGMWAAEPVKLEWSLPKRITLEDAAALAGVSANEMYGHRYRSNWLNPPPPEVAAVLEVWANQSAKPQSSRRKRVIIPDTVTKELAAFVGYLVGDGHISRVKRQLGLTSGDAQAIDDFVALSEDLFGLTPKVKFDDKGTTGKGRWRATIYSETLSDFLIEGLGLTHGPSAAKKTVPPAILRSPEPVIRAFISAYFDCDACAGKQGIILSTASDELARQVQLLLMNYGILSRIRRQTDGVYHLHITGEGARIFSEKIAFGLAREQAALAEYLKSHHWVKSQVWEDEVVSIEHGRADVYDISVTETHRYAAGGLINHNSYWHTTMMTRDILDASEVIEYADHHSGTVATRPGQFNPYKLGLELYRHIERRWNRGQFGKAWIDCEDYRLRRSWDTGAMQGRKKIFEVRRTHNDITFIDEFLTEDFVREQGIFTYEFDKNTGEFVISSRDFHAVKQKLLFMLSNRGQPRIAVIDGNHGNRGELVLRHTYEGMDMQLAWAEQTMKNLFRIWGRPIHLETILDNKAHVLHHDGKEFKKERVKKGAKVTKASSSRSRKK